jgi:hypothetical protein
MKTISEPTIENIHLPEPLNGVAGRYKTRDYAKSLTNRDRTILNETNLFPYSFGS